MDVTYGKKVYLALPDAYFSETVKTEAKTLFRNPSIPETLAVTAAKLAAPAISQIQEVHSINEAINVTMEEKKAEAEKVSSSANTVQRWAYTGFMTTFVAVLALIVARTFH